MTIEDHKHVAKEMRHDAGGVTKQVGSTYLKGRRHDDTRVHGAGASPPYIELSSQFIPLLSAAEARGSGDAASYL